MLGQKAILSEGDEFVAMKPWKAAISFPSGSTCLVRENKQILAPGIEIEPEWVYGYNGHSSKNNISILSDGSLVYHAASFGIIFDQKSNE
jgi:hypothetical protein